MLKEVIFAKWLPFSGLVLFGCVLLAQSRDTARSQQKRVRRAAESLYSNIYRSVSAPNPI